MNEEKVIYMILKDGTGSGIIECKMGLNNLICYRIPRTRLKEATKLTGINNNGIYIFIGSSIYVIVVSANIKGIKKKSI